MYSSVPVTCTVTCDRRHLLRGRRPRNQSLCVRMRVASVRESWHLAVDALQSRLPAAPGTVPQSPGAGRVHRPSTDLHGPRFPPSLDLVQYWTEVGT